MLRAPYRSHYDLRQPSLVGIQTQSFPSLQRITAAEFQESLILAEALKGLGEGIHIPNGNNDPIYPVPDPGARVGRRNHRNSTQRRRPYELPPFP